MTKKQRSSNFSVFFLLLIVLLCMNWIGQMNSRENTLDYSEIRRLFLQAHILHDSLPRHRFLTPLRRRYAVFKYPPPVV